MRDEASCTDDSDSDMLQFLPDLSQVIMLETTTGRETTTCLNAVEVVYLTIRCGKEKKFVLYIHWILKQKMLKHQLCNDEIHALRPCDQ